MPLSERCGRLSRAGSATIAAPTFTSAGLPTVRSGASTHGYLDHEAHSTMKITELLKFLSYRLS